jgi:histone H3/H4
MLRISTMHMLQSAGYDAVQKNPMAVLSDCLGRYLEFLAESAKEFAEHSGRSRITAFDVADGLSELGIDLADLKEWFVENGGVPITATSGTDGTTGEDNQATSTATGATTAAANRPVLPSWKGADPGRVLQGMPGLVEASQDTCYHSLLLQR